MSKVNIVHYLNQFFAGLGGEEAANLPIEVRDGAIGAGRLLQRHLGERGSVIATIVGGDNYVSEHQDAAVDAVHRALAEIKPTAVVAGPAFDAGRYGVACALVDHAATHDRGIPSVAAMYPENPGAAVFKDVVVVPTGTNPSEMDPIMAKVARLALKLGAGEELGPASSEGYLPRGIRRPGLREKPGYERALEMLKAKVTGQPYQSEMQAIRYEAVRPAPALRQIASGTFALITTGGIVPKGNPDRLVRGGSKEWFRYSTAGLDRLDATDWDCVHRGFYIESVKQNPNYVLPLDAARQLERQQEIGGLYPWFFSTSGVGTAILDAKRMGEQMASELRAEGVDGAILVAT